MLFFFSFFSYLKLTGATRIPEIFRTEMDASLISAVVDVLDHHLKACPDAVDEVLAVMDQLPNVGRFNLNIAFWGNAEKKAVTDLLQQVAEKRGDCESHVAELLKKYGC
jgi:hypothetical protein